MLLLISSLSVSRISKYEFTWIQMNLKLMILETTYKYVLMYPKLGTLNYDS